MVSLQKIESYTIRSMQDHDIPQALDLDKEAFPTQWPHPSYASFKQELRNRLAHYVVACTRNEFEHYVPQNNGKKPSGLKKLLYYSFPFNRRQDSSTMLPPPSREYVIGMAGFWLMAGEAHLITIGVRNAYRRQGIGERLLISFIDRAMQLRAHTATLEVRISNKDAQALYSKYGFRNTGMRKRYYADNGEDALIMSTDPLNTDAFRTQFKQLKNNYRDRWETICSINEIREDTHE